jgi:hypothetical protein
MGGGWSRAPEGGGGLRGTTSCVQGYVAPMAVFALWECATSAIDGFLPVDG